MLLKSKESKVVFVAFTQYCIQSKVTYLSHVGRVESVFALYKVASQPSKGIFI